MEMKRIFGVSALIITLLSSGKVWPGNIPGGASWVSSHGYSGCVMLENENVRVILEPNLGGRVVEYSWKGVTALHEDPSLDGYIHKPGDAPVEPSGGRCDIGPEEIIAPHPALWLGTWKAEITGKYSARMISVEDKNTGVQLIRDFRLDKNSSHLRFTQTIRNVSREIKHYFHWGRTFASGDGICIVPLTFESRFPKQYIMYGPGPVINYRPAEHPNVSVRDNFFIITGEPPQPQWGIDSYAGWLAYITRSGLLFVKKFPVYPDRPYGEIPAPTVVVWYNKDRMCELEPIGPRENILPGKSVSFTEDWWLFPFPYPSDKQVDLKVLHEFVKKNTEKLN